MSISFIGICREIYLKSSTNLKTSWTEKLYFVSKFLGQGIFKFVQIKLTAGMVGLNERKVNFYIVINRVLYYLLYGYRVLKETHHPCTLFLSNAF